MIGLCFIDQGSGSAGKGGNELQETAHITILSNGSKHVLNVNTILYVLMKKNYAEIHTFSGKCYKTRATLNELEKDLGDTFLKVSRSCLVAVMAIHDITNVIELTTDQSLPYPVRNRNEVVAQLQEKQKLIISRFSEGNIPEEEKAYPLCGEALQGAAGGHAAADARLL